MRIVFAIVASMFFCVSMSHAQDAKINNGAVPPPIVKPSRDFLMIQLTYLLPQQSVKDSIKLKSINYGFNAFLCYDFPIKKSNMSFAAGLGISASNLYLKDQLLMLSDTGKLGVGARVVNDTADYKRFKFTTAYLQAPFELRYFSNKYNRNKGFKAALGIQVGTLLGAHTKGLRGVGGSNIKEKVNTKRYISPWNFAATVRFGYGNFSVFGSYNLTPVFRDNTGPPVTPAAIGICITGL